MEPDAKIYIAGHGGLVGAALWRQLQQAGHEHLTGRTRAQLDLCERDGVEAFFRQEKPDYLFLAAARVGGIEENRTRPADFIRDNLLIQTNLIDAAWRHGVKKIMFFGASCLYPRDAPQPMREDSLLTGPPEPTNAAFSMAKLAGLSMCQSYVAQYGWRAICPIPANLYGPGDNFNLQQAHVLPALLRRFHEAGRRGDPEVTVWGSGVARREFMHVDDLARAAIFLMNHHEGADPINVGSGEEVSIRELVTLIKEVTGYGGTVRFDTSKPDGMPRKSLDSSRLHRMGWRPSLSLRQGVEETYRWFVERQGELRSGYA